MKQVSQPCVWYGTPFNLQTMLNPSPMQFTVQHFSANNSPVLDQVSLAGRMRSAGKRRRQAKRRNGSPSDDADYEPGLKLQRPRKTLSAAAMKIKSPGRTRLTLAGTASVVGIPSPSLSLPLCLDQ